MPDPDRPSPLVPVVAGLLLGGWLGYSFDESYGLLVLAALVGGLAGAQVHAARQIEALRRQLRRQRSGASVVPDSDLGRDATVGVASSRPEAMPGPGVAPAVPPPQQAVARRPAAPRADAPGVRLPPELAAALHRAWAFASGGNPIVRVALVVLFVGFGVGIRYAAQLGLFPVEARLAASGLAGLGLVGLGWSLRDRTPGFGLAVQGGGVALLYLTVYAAYALVGLLGAPVALALMAAVALVGGALAVVQDAPGLAFLGALGGFAAPVVASSGSGNHVLLFSYYLALGLGIAALVWRRGWRSLAVLGAVGTFGVGGWWGGLVYRPELYGTTQPFLIAFFGLYLVLALRLAWLDLRDREATTDRELAVDGTLVFGLPAATFVLQQGLVEGLRFGSAWSAAALAATYLGVWAWIRTRRAPTMLSDALLAVGLTFTTLAIALAFNPVVAGALWSLEAAALVWTGARQRTAWMRIAGIALGAVAAAWLFTEGVVDVDSAFSPESLTGWIVALSLGLSAYVLHRFEARAVWEGYAGRGLLAGGVAWWGLTALAHADSLTSGEHERAAVLGVLGLSSLVFTSSGRALGWPGLRRAGLLAAPVAALGALAEATRAVFDTSLGGPVEAWGWLAWGLLLCACVWALLADRRDPIRTHRGAFALLAWSLVAVAALQLVAWVPEFWGDGWRILAASAPLAAGLSGLTRLDARLAAVSTPSGRALAGNGLAVATGLWVAVMSALAGGAAPLPTLPLLSPADLAALAALAALTLWMARGDGLSAVQAWLLGTLSLGAITGGVARGAHALTGVAFEPEALFDSAEFQAALAIAWAVFALVLTVTASRRGSRGLWTAGAIVLALVVVKLFAVDLSRADALVRVGAFLGVGALMLWIGYRSPLPPRAPSDPAETDPGETTVPPVGEPPANSTAEPSLAESSADTEAHEERPA